MSNFLIDRIETYPNKRVITHAKDAYDWDRLSQAEKAVAAITVLKYAFDVETILKQSQRRTK